MQIKPQDLARLELNYDSGIIPPPYAHIFKLSIDFGDAELASTLDLMYTDRDELTEEDILNEGFTMDDDFHFEGRVNKVWDKPLRGLFEKTRWANSNNIQEGGIEMKARDQSGKLHVGTPANQQDWQFLAQDIIQAIYEEAKREAPLQIRYLTITSEATSNIHITMHFSQRKVSLKINDKAIEGNWEETKTLLTHIFLPDYDYNAAKEKTPTKRGQYIETGDGFWHDVNNGLMNIDDSFDAVNKIKSSFADLLRKYGEG